MKLLQPLRILPDAEFVFANQALFPFVATTRLTTTRNCTQNARRIATHHSPSKTPRNPNCKAMRRSREDGASHGILTRSVMTRMVRSLAAVELNRLPEKPFRRGGEVCLLQCLRGPITPVAAFGHLSACRRDV